MPTCHSTNDIALEMAQKPDMVDGTVVICQEQTKGKGQRGNTWSAVPGENLTLSIIVKPGFLRIEEQFQLNMITSLAVRETVSYFLPDKQVKVKWPNDVLVDNQKIAGILIENVISRNSIDYAVIGIGLNVNQIQFELGRATSIAKKGNAKTELVTVFEQLMHSFENYYLKMKAQRLVEIKSDYLQHLLGYRQRRKYKTEYHFDGVIEDVTSSGHLVVSSNQGKQEYDLKEIEFVY